MVSTAKANSLPFVHISFPHRPKVTWSNHQKCMLSISVNQRPKLFVPFQNVIISMLHEDKLIYEYENVTLHVHHHQVPPHAQCISQPNSGAPQVVVVNHNDLETDTSFANDVVSPIVIPYCITKRCGRCYHHFTSMCTKECDQKYVIVILRQKLNGDEPEGPSSMSMMLDTSMMPYSRIRNYGTCYHIHRMVGRVRYFTTKNECIILQSDFTPCIGGTTATSAPCRSCKTIVEHISPPLVLTDNNFRSVNESVWRTSADMRNEVTFTTEVRATTSNTIFRSGFHGDSRWLGRCIDTASPLCSGPKVSYQSTHESNEWTNVTHGNDVQMQPMSQKRITISDASSLPTLQTYIDTISSNESHEHVARNDDDEKLFGGAQYWYDVTSAPWHAKEHINSFEMRAASTAIRWMLKRPNAIGTRVMMMNDSQVTVGVMTKGRTSSHILLRRMRSIAAHTLASGVITYTRWIPSHLNPSDRASRKYAPRW